MASSSGSLETSANSHPSSNNSFTFSSHPFMTSSFSDLLASGGFEEPRNDSPERRGLGDRVADRSGWGVPKFKSIPPPSLPLSPSSFFAIPPGLSPAELLDSPVLLSSSNILPSPTTGTFPANSFNWKISSGQNQLNVKEEDKNNFTDFSFQPPSKPHSNVSSIFQSSNTSIPTAQQEAWNNFQESAKTEEKISMMKMESSLRSLSPEMASIQTNNQSNHGFQSDYGNQQPPYQSIREQRRSEDGYNWRKYGQKQVKGSENPRSYYKCTFPNCPTKKKVEKALDGQITEIVYKGSHNHPKPQSTRRSSSSSNSLAPNPVIQASNNTTLNELQEHSFTTHGSGQMDSVTTPENSSISVGDDEFDSQKSKSGCDVFDEDEPEAKRWKREGDNSEGISAPGNRTVREPRVVVQTTSDIDILDDGYRWRKYGQKVVKGNPNPRSYYKCTHPGCPVRKHVERASHDLRAVITTYEGKHNHDVPAARGSGSHVNRPLPDNNHHNSGGSSNNKSVNAGVMAIRPSVVNHHSNNSVTNLFRPRMPTSSEGESPFYLELQSPGSFGFAGFGTPMGSYMNQATENVFARAKEEPREDMFLETLLC